MHIGAGTGVYHISHNNLNQQENTLLLGLVSAILAIDISDCHW